MDVGIDLKGILLRAISLTLFITIKMLWRNIQTDALIVMWIIKKSLKIILNSDLTYMWTFDCIYNIHLGSLMGWL